MRVRYTVDRANTAPGEIEAPAVAAILEMNGTMTLFAGQSLENIESGRVSQIVQNVLEAKVMPTYESRD